MNHTLLYIYRVADFRFSVRVPTELDMESLLPSFLPFRWEEEGEELFHLDASHASLPDDGTAVQWEESVNDMGYTRLMKTDNGYRIHIRFTEQGVEHVLQANPRFTKVQAVIHWNDPYAGQVLCSMLRMVYSMAVVYHRAISIHASVVQLEGKGYLFMGKSGTGKSTHSALWQATFEGCELLNDDNPTLRLMENEVWVYGTPWSGKTPCYKNKHYPLAGMVRLKQAQQNRYTDRKDITAFITILPGCSVIRKDTQQYDTLCATLLEIIEKVKVGTLECLPDRDAALVCWGAVFGERVSG